MSVQGLITIASQHSVKDSLDRLEARLRSKNIAVFARIDHARGAQAAGLALRPTELLIFGHPKDVYKRQDIVLRGMLAPAGMERFDDILSEKDAENIHAYLIDQSWIAYRGQQAAAQKR